LTKYNQFLWSQYHLSAGEGEDVWENIEANDRFMFESNSEGIADATMVITEVKMEDRDDYMCFASNDLGTANSTILIRVIGMCRCNRETPDA
jgi:hypothetical protein